ncbi:putative Protein transport protein SEC24 [Blattamonas nauphoetae]|uniref:Uncharacterized protein n=1 Tax=Blattamonas nauphoetae TaxID=2049346 RepID=A0ABQ9XLE0_9EUKA|nr:putative Protein transport protein SEC24 [Blattamonas nauphoetae]
MQSLDSFWNQLDQSSGQGLPPQPIPQQPQYQQPQFTTPPHMTAEISQPGNFGQPQPRAQPSSMDPTDTLSSLDAMNLPISTRTITKTSVLMPYVFSDEAQSTPRFVRPTSQYIPYKNDVHKDSGFPFAITTQPFAKLDVNEKPIPIVVPNGEPIRCRRCLAYMSPNAIFSGGGRSYNCPICGVKNEVDDAYFCQLDATGKRLDSNQRPELSSGTIDLTAPPAMFSGTAHAPTLVFAVDVTPSALRSGFTQAACDAIQLSVKRLIEEGTADLNLAHVSIIAFSSVIVFFDINSDGRGYSVNIVPDAADVCAPSSGISLPTLAVAGTTLIKIASQIPKLFSVGPSSGSGDMDFDFAAEMIQTLVLPQFTTDDSALCSVLLSGADMMEHSGGKLIVFTVHPPSMNIGVQPAQEPQTLTNRLAGTQPKSQPVFPQIVQECVKNSVSVDFFIGGNNDCSTDTLTNLCQNTFGRIYLYPHFLPQSSGDPFSIAQDLFALLSANWYFGCTVKVRVSEGIEVKSAVGLTHVAGSSSDEITIPAISEHTSLTFELGYYENISAQQKNAYIQIAVLYTNARKERFVRIHNLTLTLTTHPEHIFNSADVASVVMFSSRRIIENISKQPPETIRNNVFDDMCKWVSYYRKKCAHGQDNIFPLHLKEYPSYLLALLKSPLLRPPSILPQERSLFAQFIRIASPSQLLLSLYPRVYRIDNADLVNEHRALRTTWATFSRDGAFLIDDGEAVRIWFGDSVDQNILLSFAQVCCTEQFASDINSLFDPLKMKRVPVFTSEELQSVSEPVRSTLLLINRLNSFPGSVPRSPEFVHQTHNQPLPQHPSPQHFQTQLRYTRMKDEMTEDQTYDQPASAMFIEKIRRTVTGQ